MSKHIYSTTVEVEVDVDIDTDDLTDDDLIDVCKQRGIFVGGGAGGDGEDDITEMFYAFKLGKADRAMELAKQIAQDRTGRIL